MIINGHYHLHSAFPRVYNYLKDDDTLLALVTPAIGPGPGNVVCTCLPQPPPARLQVDGNTVRAGAWRFPLDAQPRYAPTVVLNGWPDTAVHREKWAQALRLLPETHQNLLQCAVEDAPLADSAAGFSEAWLRPAAKGLRALLRGDYAAGARKLKGLGPGLTPSGDDLCAGFCLALALFHGGRSASVTQIYLAAKGHNVLSNHFLRAACDGLHYPRFKAWVIAYYTGSAAQLFRAYVSAIQLGAQSGIDTITGWLAGVYHGMRDLGLGHA